MSVFQRQDDDGVRRGAGAIIVLPDFGKGGLRSSASRLEEAIGLAVAIGLDVRDTATFRIRAAKPATLFGAGQIETLTASVNAHEIDVVIVDGMLSPVQQNNLEKSLHTKVIDRTGLILEIFGERAVSAEGRLQVEIAHLDYQAGLLVRSWTHLERQRGGFGFLGGPGETQIEADRRLIRDRMAKLRRELADLTRTRKLHRDRRSRAPWPTIALVGYTNAGKSTLFNYLTGASVMAEDLLFATLDPTMRQISLPGIEKAILSDTVGFVSDLPTQLVAAFHATLEDVIDADIIVHVRDIAHEDTEAQREDVINVLAEIGAGGEEGAPVIEAWNKIDLLDPEDHAVRSAEARKRDDVVLMSALCGDGVDTLTRILSDRLTSAHRLRKVELGMTDGAAVAWLHSNGAVESESTKGERILIKVRLSDVDFARFQARRFT